MPASIFKRYYSPLGFKIAVILGLFLILPIAGYIALHEVSEGFSIISSHYFWGWIAASFLIIMVVMSKVVIIPLKRLELEMREIEQGRESGPIILERDDEIGYLASRFNTIHRLASDEVRARTLQLSVLNNFIHATSGVLDISNLMEIFFNILGTAVEFDAGAYAFCYRNHGEGRIFSAREGLGNDSERNIRRHVLEWMHCSQAKDKILFGFTRTEPFRDGYCEAPTTASFSVDRPIVCFGTTIGVISLFFDSGQPKNLDAMKKVYDAMVQHVRLIMERLLNHIFAEERRLQNILSSMSEGVFILDNAGLVTSINRKGTDLLEAFCMGGPHCLDAGFDPCTGRWSENGICIFKLISKRIEVLGEAFEGRAYSEEISNENGMALLFSVSLLKKEDGGPEGYVITAKDVTEDRLIQKKLTLSSKLAALGEMAAGIAHEVNNPLQVMMSRVEILEKKVDGAVVKGLDGLKDSIMRIKGIVHNLLVFSKEQPVDVEEVDVNAVVEKVTDILRYQFRVDNIKIEHNLFRDHLFLKCNRNLLQQVLLNLLQNARDAITGSGTGSMVCIRTALSPGGEITIKVADNGPGIPEGIIGRIFDPFFTTKDVDHGTGLGLSISKKIIEGMGGNITVANLSGWTMFTVTLSRARPIEEKNEFALKTHRHGSHVFHEKSVLIVDDEEEVVVTVREALASLVSSVDGATDGACALEKIKNGDYDVLLLDIKMPGTNGIELLKAVEEMNPDLAKNTVFITGDTKTESTRAILASSGRLHLYKPFTLSDLLQAMSTLDNIGKDSAPENRVNF